MAAGSKTVPDSTTVGVPLPTGTSNSYHREPSRPPELEYTPELFTWMLWAVHNFPLRM